MYNHCFCRSFINTIFLLLLMLPNLLFSSFSICTNGIFSQSNYRSGFCCGYVILEPFTVAASKFYVAVSHVQLVDYHMKKGV